MKWTSVIILPVVLILLILIGYAPSLYSQTITLNEYGKIVSVDEFSPGTVSIDPQKNIFQIQYDNMNFQGSTLIPFDNGYLTLDSVYEVIPSTLRFYDPTGKLIREESFPKTINLTLSSNRKHAAFYDGSNIIAIDLHTRETNSFPGGVIFAIDDEGMPIFIDNHSGKIRYRHYEIDVQEHPIMFLFLDDTPLIFHRTKISVFGKTGLKTIHHLDGIFFDARIENGHLYFVDRIRIDGGFLFHLYSTDNFEETALLEKTILHLPQKQPPEIPTDREEIRSPLNYYDENVPAQIGNSYGNIQQYAGAPYLHPGVDLMGFPSQNVYSVHDGVVKAILTTSGIYHWRVAIANEDTNELTTGYLYAHLDQNSIIVQIGDSVKAGDLIGHLIEWPVYNFTHIHFARIAHSGHVWDGNWWTTNNPLVDITNIVDTTPPVFVNALGNDLFAFRTLDGVYLQPDNLNGKIQIISKSYDLANTHWKIDVWKIRYKIYPADEPDSPVIDTLAFVFDFPLDTYINRAYDNMVLHTIYSRDNTCFSIGNYTDREYYHILTNSRGTGEITEEDRHQYFDTSEYPNGNYIVEVTAFDAAMNSTTATMEVTLNNIETYVYEEDTYRPSEFQLIGNYPNPFNPSTTIVFSIPREEYVTMTVHDILGRVIDTIFTDQLEAGTHRIKWDAGNLPSGIYYYRIEAGAVSHTRPAILIR